MVSFCTDSERVSFAVGRSTCGGRRWRQREKEGWVENVVSALTRMFVVSSIFACSGLNWYLDVSMKSKKSQKIKLKKVQIELILFYAHVLSHCWVKNLIMDNLKGQGGGSLQFQYCQVGQTVESSVAALLREVLFQHFQ